MIQIMTTRAGTDNDNLEPHPDASGHVEAVSGGERYLLLREAPGGHVAKDQRLDRVVSVRMESGAAGAALEREARFLARLDHACIPPVHDITRTDDITLVVGRAVEGIPLAAAVAQARDGLPPPELASLASTVGVMIKVCDALAAAHARRVVHRHLNSSHIILGWYGQIHVIGWSDAAAVIDRPLTLRYVAQSTAPEVADLDDLPVDIRAVGACLFEALALIPLAGSIDDAFNRLSPAGQARLPPLLRAIVRKMLGSDGAGGYRSISEASQDLTRFLDGEAPQAYQPGALVRVGLWAHQRRRSLGIAAALVAGLLAGAWLLYGQQAQRYLLWGGPIVAESYLDESWQSRWGTPEPGMFELRDGRLVTVADRAAYAVFRTRLTTPVAIEYTGEIMPGATPGDLSVQWIETDEEVAKPESLIGQANKRRLLIQAGAYENSYCAIYQDPGYQRVSYNPIHLVPGQRHRFRIEITDERVTMDIDGRTAMEHRGRFPPTAGYLALYGYFPGKAFSDIRIYQRQVPEQVSPLAVGDGIFQLGHYADAASAYARIAASHRGRPVAEMALFRKGLCEQRLNRSDLALATWAKLSDASLREQADTFVIESHFANQEINELVARFEEQYRSRPGVRHELRRQWQDFMGRIWPNPQVQDPHLLVGRLLRLREQLFPDDLDSQFTAISGMLSIGQAAEVLKRFADDRWGTVQAHLILGQSQTVLDFPWLPRDARAWALAMQGDLAGLAEMTGAPLNARATALCQLGRPAEALERFGQGLPTLIHLGRAAELLNGQRYGSTEANNILIALGRIAEAAESGTKELPGSGRDPRALIMLGRLAEARKIAHATRNLDLAKHIDFMIAAEAGAGTALHPAIRPALPRDLRAAAGWFAPLIMAPMLEHLAGDSAAGSRAVASAQGLRGAFGQRACLITNAVFSRDGADPLPAMPAVVEVPAWHLLVTGVRSELAGNTAAAQDAYTRFRALPVLQRWLCDDGVDPAVEWFVAWRLRILAR
jgi:tetratricopeptide (TPR) repeat protein